MASTLLRRYRALLASVEDNYFDDPDLLDHLNDAKKTIVSTAIRLEMDQPKKFGRSIRALNNLRKEQTFDNLSFDQFREDIYTSEIDVSPINPDNLLYIGGMNGTQPIVFTELLQQRRYEIEVGHVKPSSQQAYWFYYTASDNKVIRTFFASEDAGIEVTVNYIKEPAPIGEDDEDLGDLPSRLEKAVIQRAAIDGANMEIRDNAENFLSLYQEQLEAHLW